MAGHRDSNAYEKKLSEAINDLPTFNAENLQSNMKVIYYSGVIAGILGFNGLMRFVLYFLILAITSIGEEWLNQHLSLRRGEYPIYVCFRFYHFLIKFGKLGRKFWLSYNLLEIWKVKITMAQYTL
ncbi:hypothetical protein UlMin_027931 [Ulmus minor]